MRKYLHLQVILVAGIALLAFGLFGYIAWATPQAPIGTPGDELAHDNMIAYREAVAKCDAQGHCSIDFGSEPPVMAGRYIGGYLISFRTCQTYTCAGVECTCADEDGDGTFTSGFGILMYDNATGKVSVLIPLDGEDLYNMHDPNNDPLAHYLPEWMHHDWAAKLLWTEWNLNNNGSGTEGEESGFAYKFAGLVGGCDYSADTGLPCGRVFLEHLIQLRARSN